ncbi:tripartite tricarboxylate transporter substrate binding protein [Variovorax guangxiensis]|uniref:tripartite tricarboxylate transporter substrate binding protein n=1 Tax=Variovorax guangxiensis TaxID=1775474 RepID=UPI00285F1067|nr:tripartite tricarboxylate transporter substrate binding protein [Variovorax guangxiensis]MDR6857392.1 tripartite-type tricarboxylate transporter receptor subunit TctC [Variovorax guangxiensis]
MNRFAPWLRTAVLTAAALAAPFATQAQGSSGSNGPDYPTKPIKLIVPYPPGGGTDVIARIVQERFQAQLGQPVVIDNRGGAAGSIGTELAAKSAADGYTVLFTLSSHTINPAIYAKLPFDTQRDFEPVAMVASLPQILVANASFPANNVAELVAMAKAKPGSLSYATVGNGSPGHLAGELFKLRTGTELTHVPYRGGGPAVTDVMGGQVPLLWVSIPAAAQFVKAGKLKALAVSTTKRSAAFPDVPTMQEAGIADFEVDSWYAMFVPTKTPKAAIEKLNRVVNTVVREPEIRDKLLAQGSEGVGGTPEQLGKVVSTELVRWNKLAKEANIRVD